MSEERRGRSGSLNVSHGKRRQNERKKSGMKLTGPVSLKIVQSEHVPLTEFDQSSYALIDSFLPLLDKGRKDSFKNILAWSDKALELHKNCGEMKGTDFSDFWGNVFHSLFRVSHQRFSASHMQKFRAVLASWEELYHSSPSESFPSLLAGFQQFLSLRKQDYHNSLIGLRPSFLVLGSLSSKSEEPIESPERKIQKISSLEQLPVSILQMKADMIESSSIGSNALDLARQALKFTKKGSKPTRGDLVIIGKGSDVPNGTGSPSHSQDAIPRFSYARVVQTEKNSLIVTTNPFQTNTIKISKAELFPGSLTSYLETSSDYPSLVDDGYETLSHVIDHVVSKKIESHLKELPGIAPCLEIFDLTRLHLKVRGKEIKGPQLALLGKLSSQIKIVRENDPPPIDLSAFILEVINSWVAQEMDASQIYIPHRSMFQSRVDTLRNQAAVIGQLRLQEIENSVQRYYFFYMKNSIFSDPQGDSPIQLEGDSSDLSIVVSSDSFSDDLASSGELDDKTILRSVEAIRRRTALAVGDGKATRRVQSARRFTTDHKWIETTHSSSLKPKTNSVKVQLQRKRVFLGTLIDECTIYCTRLEKLDILKGLPQELATDKKSRFKSKPFSVMFGTVTSIWKLEKDILNALKESLSKWPTLSIGATLRPFYSAFFRLYPSYIENIHTSILSFNHICKNSKIINNFFKKHCEASRPEDFVMDMIKLPLARIPTFSTFFQKCANDTQEDDDDYNEIQLWSIKLQELAKTLAKREQGFESLATLFELSKKISGFPGKLVKPDRHCLMEGPLTVESGVPERGGIMQEHYYYFLFSDCLVACHAEGKKKDKAFYVVRSTPLVCVESMNPDEGKHHSFTLDVGDFSQMKFTAPTSAEKQQWVEHLWESLEVIAQRKVFQVDLVELMSRQQEPSTEGEIEIPKVMFDCLHYFYSKGINKSTASILESSIAPSDMEKIIYWKDRYDSGKSVDLIAGEASLDVVVGLFKTWFHELPEPLIPWNYYSRIVNQENKSEEDKLQDLKAVLVAIPLENRVVLSHTLCLLDDIIFASQSHLVCDAFSSSIVAQESGASSGREAGVVLRMIRNLKHLFGLKPSGPPSGPPSESKVQPSQHLDLEVGGSNSDKEQRAPLGSRTRSASAYHMT